MYLKNAIKQQKCNETAKIDMVYICLLTGLVQMWGKSGVKWEHDINNYYFWCKSLSIL